MRRTQHRDLKWSSDLAYAVGLIATDGCLSPDGRHIDLTSKDLNLLEDFMACLQIKNKIGRKKSGYNAKFHYNVQFGSKNLYEFLLRIGLTPAKSHTIGPLAIPREFFADFLRGCIDGDGSIGPHKHPESQHLQLRIRLTSASINFLNWIKQETNEATKTTGGWVMEGARSYVLTFAKADSIVILKYMYYKTATRYLNRKYEIAKHFLEI